MNMFDEKSDLKDIKTMMKLWDKGVLVNYRKEHIMRVLKTTLKYFSYEFYGTTVFNCNYRH